MTKEYFKSFNIIYKREYVDPETEYDTFWSSATIYRNVPIEKIKYYRKQLLKFKAYANSKYRDEYYQTYADVFGPETAAGDDNLFNDFGQLFNGRQGFRKDFDPDFTKNYKTKKLNPNYIYNLN